MSRVSAVNTCAVARPTCAAPRAAPRNEVASTSVTRVKQAGVALFGAAVLVAAAPAFADDAELLSIGEDVFTANCIACHEGGKNSVVAERTLAKADIEKYLEGGYNEAAIIYQVKNGKNAMPAWADRLEEDEIQGVAKYVFKKAGEGWD